MVAASAAIFGLLLDQASKWWILVEVMDPPRLIPMSSFFNLTLGFNRGVSFGLLAADSPFTPWLLSGLALVVMLGFGVWLARNPGRRHGLAAGLIGGGALGNVVDRLRQGAVTDFLDFHWAGYHWPAFNIADTLIFLGAALLLLGGRRPAVINSHGAAAMPADAVSAALPGLNGTVALKPEREQG
ncbi:signal peptidase II [Pseudoroseomonas aestuarii]|uniref:Lipoprotein signal peptidase n=2 Tax=Teichococcus aestuarii TaxID=568898 RepID=A0A2U1UYY4_9PROT|nr:signal peptidase II [Pseudoroseomonas aestuarii]PWC26866.1 signal peptidase II [Pseudoroseomonas aestuarii]